jgi:hypothetical protein
MKAAVLLVLSLLASGAVTPPVTAPVSSARPAGGPWIVVEADGTRVTFAAPPENRAGRLVGRLHASGALVSIPAARVDAEATARANMPTVPAVVTPSPKQRQTRRPFETPSLGDQVRLRKTGEEAQRVLERSRTGTPHPAPAPGSTPTEAPAQEPAAPADRLGRGEEYWRERAGALRSDLQQAERVLAEAEADLEAAERANLGGSGAERTTFVVRVLEARDRAELARLEHRQARARWDALEEEARKAGAFPGWLR